MSKESFFANQDNIADLSRAFTDRWYESYIL